MWPSIGETGCGIGVAGVIPGAMPPFADAPPCAAIG